MWFGYPIEATAENWLHECLCEMLNTIHEHLDKGEDLPLWPDIIPEDHCDQLRIRTGLRERLQVYLSAVSRLSAKSRSRVIRCLVDQNCVGDLLACATECELVSDLPKAIHKPTADLFEYVFKLLTDIGVRDRHYQAIYNGIFYHVCPFCGCEYFDAPGAPREDMDHYLPKSLYPFAGANLRNLVPMGMKCNERYKLSNDILRDDAGVRRRSFDPYADHKIKVSLDNSIPFGGEDSQTPDWQIDFEPNSTECTTWDQVFHVRERVRRDVLDPSFRRWLQEFAAWFRRRFEVADPEPAIVLQAMEIYAEDSDLTGFNAREFLRAPMFRMLHHHCVVGNDRVFALMKDIVRMAALPLRDDICDN